MIYNAKEFTMNLEDKQFDCITFGNGPKPLVIIQGLSTCGIKGASLLLAYMYRIFAKEFTVYLFDRRAVVEDGITVREMARDVAEAMNELNISNASVFGVSQGGMIAQYLAIDRPDLVRKLVLVVTISRNNETIIKVVNNWIEMAKNEDMEGLILDMAEKMYSENYIKRYRPFLPILTILQKPKDIERFITLARACLTCNTYEILDQIKCPVFVIGGRKDKVTTGEACEEIAEKLGCNIYMYENLGHAMYEEAQDFTEMIYDFFID